MLSDYVGPALSTTRKKIGLSQSNLAELVSVSQVYISQIETKIRRPSIDIVEKISRALKCRVSDIIKLAEKLQKPSFK